MRVPTFAITVPTELSAADPGAIEPTLTVGVAAPLPLHENLVCVLAGTMSLMTTLPIVPGKSPRAGGTASVASRLRPMARWCTQATTRKTGTFS